MISNLERTGDQVDVKRDNQAGFPGGATVVAVKEQVSCDLAGEAVILNFSDGTYYGLNAVGAAIWALIQTPRTVEEIRTWLLSEYSVDAPQCELDLQAFLSDLSSRKLISIRNGRS